MKRIILSLILAVTVSAASAARAIELFSFTINAAGVGCTGSDYSINAAGFPIGAGVFHTGPSTIVGTDVWSRFIYPSDYVMVGHTPPNGDAISTYVFGASHPPALFYPSGYGFLFDPRTDELHIHYTCLPSEGSGDFGVTVFYTVP